MAAATTKQKQLTPVQRAAAVVIALGADRASEVYRYLKDDEVEQISLEIAKLNRLSPEDMQSTIEDFYGLCVTQKVITEGGVLYAKDVLEKAFGPEQASSYMDRLSKSLRTRSFESIRKADYKNLWMILQNEHPQTIALVLSYARSDQAAQIIAELPRAVQLDVVERIAGLDRVSPEMIKLVEDSLEARFTNITSADQVEVGGVPYVAEIMNRVDRSTEKYIFDELADAMPLSPTRSTSSCSPSRTLSIWTAWLSSGLSGKWIPRIWLWPSRAQTKKSSVLSSRTCPPVCGRISSRISSSCTTSGCAMWKRPSRRLSA